MLSLIKGLIDLFKGYRTYILSTACVIIGFLYLKHKIDIEMALFLETVLTNGAMMALRSAVGHNTINPVAQGPTDL